MLRNHHSSALALALGALLALSACGGNVAAPTDTASSGAAVATATGNGQVAPSITAAPQTYAPGATIDPKTFFMQQGVAMAAAKTFRTETTSVTKQGDTEMKSVTVSLLDTSDPNNEKSRTTTTGIMGDSDIIMIGDTTYTKMPGATKYVKSTSGPVATEGIPGVTGGDEIPATDEGITKVVYVGPDTVNGISAHHYEMTMRNPTGDSGAAEIPVGVWLDASGRIVKYAYTASFNGMTTELSIIYSQYGQPVNIVAPPADQVEG